MEAFTSQHWQQQQMYVHKNGIWPLILCQEVLANETLVFRLVLSAFI